MYKYSRGVTLVELMVTLAVLAILITVGIPGLGNFIQMTRHNSAFEVLSRTYQFARQEAVHRVEDVHICPADSALQNVCGNNWSDGLLVYLELNGQNDYQAEDQLLKEVFFSDGVSLNWNNGNRLEITSQGSVSTAGRFKLEVNDRTACYQLIISRIGRARSVKDTQALCP